MKIILASKSKLVDWITSKVVLVFPESYSSVIPSFAKAERDFIISKFELAYQLGTLSLNSIN